jgi:hypothetical protein
MSDDRERLAKKLRNKRRKPRTSDDTDYEIGYGKPPKRTQFQPGVSGNPRGKPRGSKNLRPALREDQLVKLIFQEANRKINIREDGLTRKITMAEAILRSLAAKAAQGNRLHQKLFLDLYSQSGTRERERDERILDGIIDYKLKAEQELKRCKALGEEPPDLPIHPDDIQIDMETGEITYTGPTAWDRKTEDRIWRARKAAQRQEIACLERELEKTEDPEMRKSIERDIENARDILSLLAEILGDNEPEPTKQK